MSQTTLSAEAIGKRFGPTVANDDVYLTLQGGEVHALLGQNGAGKSTLVGVLTGRLVPDGGRVVLDGKELPTGNPRAATARGIATVYQELILVPAMTGLENVALALRTAATRALRRKVLAVQRRFELPADLDVPVQDLELPQRQRIELLRALCQEPTVLLLDEPTSLLPPTMIRPFLEKVRSLADAGLAVMLITHRLDEARSVSDRVTVLRQGRVVASYSREELPNNRELATAMLGTTIVEQAQVSQAPQRVALEAENVSALDARQHLAVDSVSLVLREGEILGVAGVDGNGQLELLEALAGLRRIVSGSIRYRGEETGNLSYLKRHKMGIHYLSGDRRRHGIVPTFTVDQHFRYASWPGSLESLPAVLSRYGVRPPDPAFRADRLSGGNQQKLILSRACTQEVGLLLLSYPTQGLDVQATINVRDILLERASQGTGIVIASSDLDDLLAIANRIAVMSRGRIVGELDREKFDRIQLAEWFTTSVPEADVAAAGAGTG